MDEVSKPNFTQTTVSSTGYASGSRPPESQNELIDFPHFCIFLSLNDFIVKRLIFIWIMRYEGSDHSDLSLLKAFDKVSSASRSLADFCVSLFSFESSELSFYLRAVRL
jgi:hypothetical protein